MPLSGRVNTSRVFVGGAQEAKRSPVPSQQPHASYPTFNDSNSSSYNNPNSPSKSALSARASAMRRVPDQGAIAAQPYFVGGSSGDSTVPSSSLSSDGGLLGLNLSNDLSRSSSSSGLEMDVLHHHDDEHVDGGDTASHRLLPAHLTSGPPPSTPVPGGNGGGISANWKVFDQGMRFGCMLSLLAWVMWDAIVDARLRPADQDLWVQLVLPVYRGMGCLVLAGWCWGCSLYVWDRYHINYPFLFELDPRLGVTIMPAGEVLDEVTKVTIVYLGNFLMYFKIMRGDFPGWVVSGWFPFWFVLYIMYKVLPLWSWVFSAPAPLLSGGSAVSGPGNRNAPLWASLGQVPLAPFGRVNFLSNLLGDVWTSMVKVSVDLAYTGCFIAGGEWTVEMDVLAAGKYQTQTAVAGGEHTKATTVDTCLTTPFFKRVLIPLLSALPLWFRFMQCLRRYLSTRKRWPHIGNACKYALSHSVILFGVFNSAHLAGSNTLSLYKAVWILAMVLSTLYTYWWDLYMDWGLGRWKFGLLRDELMFPNKLVYYAAMVADLGMRFAWTVTLVPQGEDSPLPRDFMLVR